MRREARAAHPAAVRRAWLKQAASLAWLTWGPAVSAGQAGTHLGEQALEHQVWCLTCYVVISTLPLKTL